MLHGDTFVDRIARGSRDKIRVVLNWIQIDHVASAPVAPVVPPVLLLWRVGRLLPKAYVIQCPIIRILSP